MLIKINDKEYSLRKKTLGDLVWLQNTFGAKLEGLFDKENNLLMSAVTRCVYHFIEDKKDFQVREVETVDEDGNFLNEKIGGWKLLASMYKDEVEKLIETFNDVMELGEKKSQ